MSGMFRRAQKGVPASPQKLCLYSIILSKLKDWGKEASIHLSPVSYPGHLGGTLTEEYTPRNVGRLGQPRSDVELAWYQCFVGIAATRKSRQETNQGVQPLLT